MSPETTSVPIVTIDGPSSSGKGTISRIVASKVGWNLLDSGALYRLVALGGILKNLDPDDVEEHVAVARSMRVEFGSVGTGEERVLLDGRDVTQKIRGEQAGAGASRVAAWPAVRSALTDKEPSRKPPVWSQTDGIWARSSFRAPS
jgi:CMP/dCMP kinase